MSGTVAARGHPRVYLHIGEPKTGTTFLQQVMWRNRSGLAAQRVVLPGHHPQDHFRAAQDLRDIPKLSSDPAGPWTGEWNILAEQAMRARDSAVISHELLSAVTPDQAARALRSLAGAEVHVVLTVRDMATLLPAEWQESVKHRNTRAWDDWLADVIDKEALSEDRRQWWFWRVHDTLAIMDMFAADVPPDRVHVVTVPRQGGSQDVLWQRFAAVLGIDPSCADTSRARPNASLGVAEIELLRRVNEALTEDVPDWFYMWNVKEPLAHGVLASRPTTGRLVLPPARDEWASAHAHDLIAALSERGCHIVGALDELLPTPGPIRGAHPDNATCAQMLDAAVASISELTRRHYQRTQRTAPHPGPGPRPPQGVAARVVVAVQSSPRLKRAVRRLSSRHRTVARLRVLAWRVLQRSRQPPR